jgi:hypothetical protein
MKSNEPRKRPVQQVAESLAAPRRGTRMLPANIMHARADDRRPVLRALRERRDTTPARFRVEYGAPIRRRALRVWLPRLSRPRTSGRITRRPARRRTIRRARAPGRLGVGTGDSDLARPRRVRFAAVVR